MKTPKTMPKTIADRIEEYQAGLRAHAYSDGFKTGLTDVRDILDGETDPIRAIAIIHDYLRKWGL